MTDALIIGGGPAGLMAADVLSAAGHSVVVADAMPTVGRKFLMAGKSGLNLTKAEDAQAFQSAFGGARAPLKPILSAFGPNDVSDWAIGLGQDVFTGTTGRVFPTKMKASPL
jgi:predicted flavoprotein YhiN